MPQTYLITGASRGIGLEFARQLSTRAASTGDTILATARDPAKATELNALKGVTMLTLDVASEASIEGFTKALASRPIDVLINNAGISNHMPDLASCTLAKLQDVFTTNTFAPILLTKALLPNISAGAGKRIINITSVLGSMGLHHTGFSYGYCASKAALNMLTQKLATELAKSHPTSCIIALHPGWVQTEMGGKEATLTPTAAVQTMLTTIAGLTPASTGAYLNTDGAVLPW